MKLRSGILGVLFLSNLSALADTCEKPVIATFDPFAVAIRAQIRRCDPPLPPPEEVTEESQQRESFGKCLSLCGPTDLYCVGACAALFQPDSLNQPLQSGTIPALSQSVGTLIPPSFDDLFSGGLLDP